jgi:hypothetical protein
MMPGADDLGQRRHGEVRRSHENDAQGHGCGRDLRMRGGQA